jgi:aryl-alcohol dehydrogenase-like predicted oxidoreductase
MAETNALELRELGKTGIHVTPIGLGMMEFSGGGGLLGNFFPVINQPDKNAIVKAALDGGIDWFDTAEMYGGGVSERSLSDALKANGKSDADVLVATKWFPLFRTAGNIPHTIDKRLGYLNGFSVGLYMIHQPYSFSSPEAEMDAMAGLVKAGKIRSVGVSNFSPERMRRAHAALQKHGIALAVNQVHYSLLHRDIESNGVLETAKELGVTIIAYTPLASGLLSGKYHKNPDLIKNKKGFSLTRIKQNIESSRPLIEAMDEIAARYPGANCAQVALNWVINAHGSIVVTIPGATKVYQAQDAAAAMHFKLTQAELDRLSAISKK